MQCPGSTWAADNVLTAMDDGCVNTAQQAAACLQQVFAQPAAVNHVVALDASKADCCCNVSGNNLANVSV